MMNQNERSQLSLVIATMAKYYGRQIDRDVVSMMIDDLQDLDLNQVRNGYENYRRDPKNRTFPLPAQIRGIVSPEPTSDSIAREILDRINKAISKFGYMALLPAKEFIGEIGWKYVESCGGWARLCESDFIHNGAAQAQARTRLIDLAQYGSNALALALTKREESEFEETKLLDFEKKRQLLALVDHMKKNDEGA